MSLVKKPNSPFLHYEFQLKGHRFRGSTGEATRARAQQVEADIRREALAEIAIDAREIARGKRPNQPLTLKDVAAEYWEQKAARQVRSDQVLWSLNWLTAYFGDDMLITKIDSAAISKMVAKRRGEPVVNRAAMRSRKHKPAVKQLSPARVNRSVIEPLRKVLYFARDTLGQHIQPIKWKQYLVKEPDERIRVMKVEQEAAILPHLAEKYHPLVYIKKRIGPRIFELLKMKWSDIDWSGPRVEIEGKGGSRNSVPLPTDVRDVLWALPRRGERVFTHEDGGSMTYSVVDSAWNRACAKAGVSDLHLHDLRHSAATDLLRQSGNLKLVQKMLRHRDIRSTLRYAHADDGDLLAALEKSSPQNPPQTLKSLKAQA
jgi:integrase